MSAIRVIYRPRADGSRSDPGFPATDQHPLAVRYPFDHPIAGALNVDALNGAPSQTEIDAILFPVINKDAEARKALDADPAAPPNIDLFKLIKAKAISDEAYRLGIAPGALTSPQLASLRNRIAAIYAAL